MVYALPAAKRWRGMVKPRTYLSIDIDYFNGDKDSLYYVLQRITSEAAHREIPVKAVTNHQQLLRYANALDCGDDAPLRLINVDHHPDVVVAPTALNCGSWLNYVRWRQRGTLTWVRDDDERRAPTYTDWGGFKVECHRPAALCPGLLMDDTVVGIGFCRSPSYTEKDISRAFMQYMRGAGIPVTEGVYNEDTAFVEREPPGSDRYYVYVAEAQGLDGLELYLGVSINPFAFVKRFNKGFGPARTKGKHWSLRVRKFVGDEKSARRLYRRVAALSHEDKLRWCDNPRIITS
jgi:hypothetical protein